MTLVGVAWSGLTVGEGSSARRIDAGSRPSAEEMSLIPSRIAPGSGPAARPWTFGAQAGAIGYGSVLRCFHAVQVEGRVDDTAGAEVEQRGRVDLEVQMHRGRLRIAGVAQEADHLACTHARIRSCAAVEKAERCA